MSTPPVFEPITKIVVMVDSENAYVAGDDTGKEISIPCPYGTQEMAEKLLEQLGGYRYQPMVAEDALIDPAAELGDAVTVAGVYTVYAEKDIEFDHLLAANISAPGEKELLQEYGYQTPTEQINYRLAKTRSLITKTAEQILLKVEGSDGTGGLTGAVSSLSVELGKITQEVSGKIDGEQASALISTELGKVTLSASSTGGTTTLTLSGGGISATAENVDLTVKAVNISGTVTAGILKSGEVRIKGEDDNDYGIMYAGTNRVGTTALEIYGGNGLRLSATGNVYLHASTGGSLTLGEGLCSLQNGALVISPLSFGNSLPETGIQGQVYFLEA